MLEVAKLLSVMVDDQFSILDQTYSSRAYKKQMINCIELNLKSSGKDDSRRLLAAFALAAVQEGYKARIGVMRTSSGRASNHSYSERVFSFGCLADVVPEIHAKGFDIAHTVSQLEDSIVQKQQPAARS